MKRKIMEMFGEDDEEDDDDEKDDEEEGNRRVEEESDEKDVERGDQGRDMEGDEDDDDDDWKECLINSSEFSSIRKRQELITDKNRYNRYNSLVQSDHEEDVKEGEDDNDDDWRKCLIDYDPAADHNNNKKKPTECSHSFSAVSSIPEASCAESGELTAGGSSSTDSFTTSIDNNGSTSNDDDEELDLTQFLTKKAKAVTENDLINIEAINFAKHTLRDLSTEELCNIAVSVYIAEKRTKKSIEYMKKHLRSLSSRKFAEDPANMGDSDDDGCVNKYISSNETKPDEDNEEPLSNSIHPMSSNASSMHSPTSEKQNSNIKQQDPQLGCIIHKALKRVDYLEMDSKKTKPNALPNSIQITGGLLKDGPTMRTIQAHPPKQSSDDPKFDLCLPPSSRTYFKRDDIEARLRADASLMIESARCESTSDYQKKDEKYCYEDNYAELSSLKRVECDSLDSIVDDESSQCSKLSQSAGKRSDSEDEEKVDEGVGGGSISVLGKSREEDENASCAAKPDEEVEPVSYHSEVKVPASRTVFHIDLCILRILSFLSSDGRKRFACINTDCYRVCSHNLSFFAEENLHDLSNYSKRSIYEENVIVDRNKRFIDENKLTGVVRVEKAREKTKFNKDVWEMCPESFKEEIRARFPRLITLQQKHRSDSIPPFSVQPCKLLKPLEMRYEEGIDKVVDLSAQVLVMSRKESSLKRNFTTLKEVLRERISPGESFDCLLGKIAIRKPIRGGVYMDYKFNESEWQNVTLTDEEMQKYFICKGIITKEAVQGRITLRAVGSSQSANTKRKGHRHQEPSLMSVVGKHGITYQ